MATGKHDSWRQSSRISNGRSGSISPVESDEDLPSYFNAVNRESSDVDWKGIRSRQPRRKPLIPGGTDKIDSKADSFAISSHDDDDSLSNEKSSLKDLMKGKEPGKSPADQRQDVTKTEQSVLLNNDSHGTSPFHRLRILVYRSYFIWRWTIRVYLLWLFLSHLIMGVYRVNAAVTAYFDPESTERPIADPNKLYQAQARLGIITNNAAEMFSLTREVMDREYALQDLLVRVEASKLHRKDELVLDLGAVREHALAAVSDVQKFTGRISKAIDEVRTLDDFGARMLASIAHQQANPPSRSRQIVKAISPLGAFDFVLTVSPEQQIKNVFAIVTSGTIEQARKLLKDRRTGQKALSLLQSSLVDIQRLMAEELGDAPRHRVLAMLWDRLGRLDTYSHSPKHERELTNLATLFARSHLIISDTLASLERLTTDLITFESSVVNQFWVLKDQPIQTQIAELRNAFSKFETGQKRLRDIENGQRMEHRILTTNDIHIQD